MKLKNFIRVNNQNTPKLKKYYSDANNNYNFIFLAMQIFNLSLFHKILIPKN